jgi:hypothetical protein
MTLESRDCDIGAKGGGGGGKRSTCGRRDMVFEEFERFLFWWFEMIRHSPILPSLKPPHGLSA